MLRSITLAQATPVDGVSVLLQSAHPESAKFAGTYYVRVHSKKFGNQVYTFPVGSSVSPALTARAKFDELSGVNKAKTFDAYSPGNEVQQAARVAARFVSAVNAEKKAALAARKAAKAQVETLKPEHAALLLTKQAYEYAAMTPDGTAEIIMHREVYRRLYAKNDEAYKAAKLAYAQATATIAKCNASDDLAQAREMKQRARDFANTESNKAARILKNEQAAMRKAAREHAAAEQAASAAQTIIQAAFAKAGLNPDGTAKKTRTAKVSK